MEAVERVAAVLGREDAILFVGSGASIWSGLPSWGGLIKELSSELESLGRRPEVVERELSSGDLLLAASYGVDQMSPEEKCAFLRRVIERSKPPSELHRELVRLGPTCFLTTNYDKLIERALREVGDDFDVVTPADTLELPSIIQARSTHFVFKPHGDISSCATIVFTREDYRELVGERRAVFEAMRMLLASRPVVFVGFGLRDPDFLQLRDLLFGTFQTNPADHFAIMADVLEEERDYWRRHHGISLISYETIRDGSVTNRHAPLLDLLRAVRVAIEGRTSRGAYESTVFTMARYARGLSVEYPLSETEDIPLKLVPNRTHDDREWKLETKLRGEAITALTHFRGHLLVEGAPGAGKSHVVRRAVGALASQLLVDCLSSEAPDLGTLRVPILIEMRDYQGDLRAMVAERLPAGVRLESLLRVGAAVVILDGLNEAPEARRFEETLTEQLDAFLQMAANNTVIVTTRSAAPVRELRLSVATLDAVNEGAVKSRLATLGIEDGELNPAMLDLLRRPLFFRAWLDGSLDLTGLTSIHAIYLQILGRFDIAASDKFERVISVAAAMGEVAAQMIDHGGLTAERAEILTSLKSKLPPGVSAQEFYDFVVDQQLLVPTSMRRLAFYHHSVAEYVAAHHLAELIASNKDVVVRYLGRRDWDQALLLTLGFLPQAMAIEVHDLIMRVDPGMGLRGLNFIDDDQEQWVRRSLAALPAIVRESESRILWLSLAGIPVRASHRPELEVLAALPDALGGEALGILARLDADYVAVAIKSIVSGARGYNYLSELGQQLSAHADRHLAANLFQQLNDRPLTPDQDAVLLSGGEKEELTAVVTASAEVLQGIDDETLIELASEAESNLVRVVLGSALRDRRTARSADFLRAEIERGRGYAVVDHCFQLRFGKPVGGALPTPSTLVIEKLRSFISDERIGSWALDVLKMLAEMDSSVAAKIRSAPGEGLQAALMAYAVGDNAAFQDQLISLAAAPIDWQAQPAAALGGVDGWAPEPLMALLGVRDNRIAKSILESLQSNDDAEISLEISNLATWIEWLRELSHEDDFLVYLLGRFLARRTNASTRRALIDWFSAVPADRELLSHFVLRDMPELKVEDFEPPVLEWLIARAAIPTGDWRGPLIAQIATEELVEERLLPLLAATSGPNRQALVAVLLEIGRRLDRRYVSDDGSIALTGQDLGGGPHQA